MKIKHYVITAVVTYLSFLIISVPATMVTGLLSEHMPQVNIQGVSGTLWNGSAQRISLSHSHVIDDVDWTFCAWRLLTAEACLDLQATYKSKTVKGQLGVGITGTLQARDLSTEMDAQLLGDLAGLPIGELNGLVNIHLESANWSQGQVPSITGNILWNSAAITVAETADLGDIAITLEESDDYPLTAITSNKGGQLALNGESHINDDGSYNLELKLSPNNTATKNLRGSLEMFAKKQNDGSFVLKNTGNLKQYGIM